MADVRYFRTNSKPFWETMLKMLRQNLKGKIFYLKKIKKKTRNKLKSTKYVGYILFLFLVLYIRNRRIICAMSVFGDQGL